MPPAAVAARRPTAQVMAVLFALLASLVSVFAAPARADSGAESQFVSLVNQERAAAGRPALKVASDLTSVARKHSKVMADADKLHHNPNLGSAVSGWKKVGENVGRGPTVSAIHNAFMASSGHKRNILDADWVEVGVGVVVRDGQIWVTEVFRLPKGATPAPEPKPDPKPEPKQEPAPEPKKKDGSKQASEPKPEPKPAPEAAPKPEPAPAKAAPPEPEPHEVVDKPLALDRVTLTLARLEASEGLLALDEVLGG